MATPAWSTTHIGLPDRLCDLTLGALLNRARQDHWSNAGPARIQPRYLAREGSEGLHELVVRIGPAISYQELNANQPAQPPAGVISGRAPHPRP
jgi:hypothetical protein